MHVCLDIKIYHKIKVIQQNKHFLEVSKSFQHEEGDYTKTFVLLKNKKTKIITCLMYV